MKVERIEAKRFHCGRLARLMRYEHAAIIAGHPHIKAHRNIVQFFDQSSAIRAWTIDGELVALAGVTGSRMDASGIAWLVLSEKAQAHPIAVSREALKFMDWLRITKNDITIVILADDKKAIQFAYFLDFKSDRRETIDGVETILMSARPRKAA